MHPVAFFLCVGGLNALKLWAVVRRSKMLGKKKVLVKLVADYSDL
jgi:hypothetical protein